MSHLSILSEHFAKARRQAEDAAVGCLIGPVTECSQKIIWAHSIPKARLRLIADKRHEVLIMTPDPNKMLYHALKSEQDNFFERRKIRNRLMTARMACERHDNQVFSKIEDNQLDPSDPEHCALLAYRAVLFELYKKKVSRDFFSALHLLDPIVPFYRDFMADGVRAAEDAKTQLEKDLFSWHGVGSSSAIDHQAIVIESEPQVAATTAIRRDGSIPFTPRELGEVRRRRVPRLPNGVSIVMTVYPEAERQIAVFSFPKGTGSLARIVVPAIDESDQSLVAALLSKTLLEEAENIMVSTKAWQRFSDAKRKRISEQFMGTIPKPLLVPVPTGVTAIPEELMSEITYAEEPDFIDNCDPEEVNLFT